MSDADGDSTMHSSPEHEPDDEMFPDEGPRTPRNTSGALQASELSPPSSQGPRTTGLSGDVTGLNANTHLSSSGLASSGMLDADGVVHTDPATGYQWSKPEDQPGFKWKNNRARDEELRALDLIVDRDQQIKTRYGDPLKPELPMTMPH